MTLQRLSKALPLLLLPGCLLTPLFFSCDNGCEQIREHFLHVCFTSTSGRTIKSMSLNVLSEGKNYEETGITDLSDVEIDLNPTSDSIMLCLNLTYTDYGDSFTKADTLTIRYRSNPQFLDLSCGCTYLYELNDVQQYTHSVISHIKIEDPQINDTRAINITFEY